MVKKVTINSKRQITLPKDLRDKYHMSYGESVWSYRIPGKALLSNMAMGL